LESVDHLTNQENKGLPESMVAPPSSTRIQEKLGECYIHQATAIYKQPIVDSHYFPF